MIPQAKGVERRIKDLLTWLLAEAQHTAEKGLTENYYHTKIITAAMYYH